MATMGSKGAFNLKAVVCETGVKPDTLRAWERRYGLPEPKRTAGGHRLYSQRDIDTLRWLVARQAEGLSISRAVDLWRGLETDGSDPLETPPYALGEAHAMASPIAAGESVDGLRQAWVEACSALDEKRAEQVLAQACALYPLETVIFGVLRQGLAEIGEAWYRGGLTVQQEHFASALAIRRLEALLSAAPAPTRRTRLVVACPPSEGHTFPPLVLTLLLRRRGWDVTYLGADVPIERMEEVVESARPNLVVLTAQQLLSAAHLAEMAAKLGGERVAVAYGGRIFSSLPALRGRIPGHYLGDRLEAAAPSVERILVSPPPQPKPAALSQTLRRALAHFRSRRALIDADVWEAMDGQVDPDWLANANQQMGSGILAALALGDLGFLDPEVHWLEGLINHHGVPRQLLSDYLACYRRGAERHLEPAGLPVVDWLRSLTTAEPRE